MSAKWVLRKTTFFQCCNASGRTTTVIIHGILPVILKWSSHSLNYTNLHSRFIESIVRTPLHVLAIGVCYGFSLSRIHQKTDFATPSGNFMEAEVRGPWVHGNWSAKEKISAGPAEKNCGHGLLAEC